MGSLCMAITKKACWLAYVTQTAAKGAKPLIYVFYVSTVHNEKLWNVNIELR